MPSHRAAQISSCDFLGLKEALLTVAEHIFRDTFVADLMRSRQFFRRDVIRCLEACLLSAESDFFPRHRGANGNRQVAAYLHPLLDVIGPGAQFNSERLGP